MHSDFAGNKMLVSITENACRVCLAEQEIMINLFDTVEDFEKKRLYDLLESCSSIKIDRADGQRKLICGDCTGELLVVAKFQAKCEQTMEILSQMEHLIVDEDKSPASEEGCEVDDDKVKYEMAEIEHSLDNADDMDNFIIEEHDIVDEEVEADGAISPLPDETRPEENIIFQEVSYVDEEDADNEDLILFEPDPGTDCTAHSKRQNVAEKLKLKTTVTPRPLIINYKCDVCGAGFAQVNNLARHIQTHNPAEVYECSTCHHPFTSSLHVELHNEENPKCGDTVEKQIKMCTYDTKEGILSTKSDEIPVVTEKTPPTSDDTRKSKLCNICNKAFVSKSALETHLRIHTGDRPFKCSICLKGFKSQGGLVLHLRRHSGIRPYSCNVCNKSFSESSNLRVHMRTHTGEKPHKCTICNRSFARVFLLQLHLRTHTGERPYQCPYCSKAFAQAGDLTSHKRTHTGERPHVCPICKKGFIKSSGLTQHMRKHTNQGAKYDSIMACEDSSQDKEDDREEGTDWHIIHEDQITENDGETDDLSGLRMEFKVEDYVIEFPQEIET